jgi:hypothetical protein
MVKKTVSSGTNFPLEHFRVQAEKKPTLTAHAVNVGHHLAETGGHGLSSMPKEPRFLHLVEIVKH